MDADQLIIDHQRAGFTFDASTHTYRLKGRRLASVTQVTDLVSRPFDARAAAERVAAREGRTPEAVLAAWEVGRDKAARYGTMFHDDAERIVLGGRPKNPMDLRVRGFQRYWREKLAPKLRVVATEQRVFHPAYPLAGTFDLLARGDKGLWVIDWKTNKKFDTSSRWGGLLEPFHDLCDCKLCYYSIQVSLYRVILEDSGHSTAGGLIVHVPPVRDGDAPRPRPHVALDLRERVRQWLPTVDWATVTRED